MNNNLIKMTIQFKLQCLEVLATETFLILAINIIRRINNINMSYNRFNRNSIFIRMTNQDISTIKFPNKKIQEEEDNNPTNNNLAEVKVHNIKRKNK
jgi:hypothetical protein